jgi:hypothetical protein
VYITFVIMHKVREETDRINEKTHQKAKLST